MATWRAENSMLTQRGVEILNKLKAGVGSITITRIVAGSGRVAYSKLYSQTSVSGVQKDMVISSKNTTESGSEISVYIENKDFAESYDLHQIGVYVTHPDYVGEQLYHISQCDAEDFDTIPAVTDTPVTQGYSIFMEHGNSSAISITIDPQGMITREEFNSYKESVVATNILDNWYLANPIDTKKGLVVPPNTPYYTEMDNSVSETGITTFYTSVSVVGDNWCSLVIDDVTYYCDISYTLRGYREQGIGIDRFQFENITALITEDGLTLIAPENIGDTNKATMYQPTSRDNANSVVKFPITVSVLLSDGRFANTTITSVEDGMTGFIDDDLIFGIAYVGLYKSWQLFRCTVTPGHSVTIKAVKTELGTKQTLAHKDSDGKWVLNEVPNYSVEMAKCAQYGTLVRAKTDAEIDFLLLRLIGSMTSFETKTYVLSIDALDASLDGGTWFITINKTSPFYATVSATRYSTSGMLNKMRSLINGTLTGWATATFTPVFNAALEE